VNPAGTSTASKALFVLVAAGAAIYLIIPTSHQSADGPRQAEGWTPSVSTIATMTGEPRAAAATPTKSPAPLPQYVRKPTAPNGQAWPAWSSYIPGYPIRKTGGVSSFEFSNIEHGSFDVRYMDLDTGKIAKSNPFELEEVGQGNGTRYSRMSLTLYPVRNGNTQAQEIEESEF
jgi:hypothetical protein